MSALRSGFGIVAFVGLCTLPWAPPLGADDGDLDLSYDGGAFTIGWGADDVRASVVEPIADGELLVGGTLGNGPEDNPGWVVAKLEADGTRDIAWALSFEIVYAGDETMAVTDQLHAMERDAEGRTWLAGSADFGIGNHVPMLARLGPGGGLDDTFHDNGIWLLDSRPAGWEELKTKAAAVLPDGRSVFVGTCEHCPIEGESWAWVARRLADGSADPSFSDDGWLSLRFAVTGNAFVTAVAVDEGGRIVVAGGMTVLTNSGLHLARLTPSGGADGTFGGDAVVGPWDTLSARDLALDPSSGRIAMGIGNSLSPGGGEVRVLTAAGELDTTFSGDGVVPLDREEGASIHTVAFQSDGKLVAAGMIDANGTNEGGFFLARMTAAGALDSSYDDNGFKRVEFDAAANVEDGAFAVATMGGRLVAVGSAGAGGGQDEELAVVRTESALVFADGFERGSTEAWAGE